MRTAFTEKMYDLCELAPQRVTGYYPSDFRQALDHAGDDFAPRARQFLRTGLQSGIERLARGKALDISMEWSIAYDGWSEFDEEDRRLAHERLAFLAKMHKLDPPPPLDAMPRRFGAEKINQWIAEDEAEMRASRRGEQRQ